MVEGSQIDWAGHDHDIVSAMSEMKDFEKAFEEAIRFAKRIKHVSHHDRGSFNWRTFLRSRRFWQLGLQTGKSSEKRLTLSQTKLSAACLSSQP